MRNFFVEQGRAILNNGYLIVPLQPGTKRPSIANWQNARFSVADLATSANHGIGVLCGQGNNPIAAFDIDTTNHDLANRFVEWCREHLGATCERVGRAPKVLLTYRAESAGWAKAAGAWFEDKHGTRHRLEVLGKGQRFVAYNIHPDTGLPYEWVDGFGGLAAVKAEALPLINAAQIKDALRVFEAMALVGANLVRLQHGATDDTSTSPASPSHDDDFLMSLEPRVGLNLEEVPKLIQSIDNVDYDTWLKVGMALHHEFDGSAAALDLWDNWSSNAPNYVGFHDLKKVWASFGTTGRRPVTARWLLKAGREARNSGQVNHKLRRFTEFGNADRMLDQYGDTVRYAPELNTWYMWNGSYWDRTTEGDIEYLAKETIRMLPDEATNLKSDVDRAAFLKFCTASQKVSMSRNMVHLAQLEPQTRVRAEALDKHSHLLGVANGAVDLRTGKLVPPTPAYYITTLTPILYDEDAVCPLFESTVADVFFNDAEMVSFFQRLIGYSILAQPDEGIIVIPYGLGANGKSTVLGAIRGALGAHAKTASVDTFLSIGATLVNAGAAREDVIRLRGARFVYVCEPDEGSVLREALIKAMTGGEALPARGIYSRSTIEVVPTWVAFMPTNYLPIIKGGDHAIWRRLLPVPFLRNFDQDTTLAKDPDRAEKLKAEAQGILAWCVRGALAYKKEGLRPPNAVRQAREEYKHDMDLLKDWLDECCEVGPRHAETTSQLWASWEMFAKSRGDLRLVPSCKSLGRRLSAQGFRSVRNTYGLSGRGFIGLRVKQCIDFPSLG